MMTLVFYSIFQDWPRHRAECIPAMSPSNCYNVNMIATPPPAEPQFVNVSAILFAPEEGELVVLPQAGDSGCPRSVDSEETG